MLSIKMPKNREITPEKYAGNISGKSTKRNNANGMEKKKILVTGMYPYVGRAFACFMCRWPDRYRTDLAGIKRIFQDMTQFFIQVWQAAVRNFQRNAQSCTKKMHFGQPGLPALQKKQV